MLQALRLPCLLHHKLTALPVHVHVPFLCMRLQMMMTMATFIYPRRTRREGKQSRTGVGRLLYMVIWTWRWRCMCVGGKPGTLRHATLCNAMQVRHDPSLATVLRSFETCAACMCCLLDPSQTAFHLCCCYWNNVDAPGWAFLMEGLTASPSHCPCKSAMRLYGHVTNSIHHFSNSLLTTKPVQHSSSS